ncbi:hypothetical protein GCM10028895_25530 [Pontibacter rugosus]
MTCPSDITTNVSDNCEAVVTYTNPIPTIANVFNYTGEVQTYTVPAGVTSIKVDVVGASGGYSYPSSSNKPGLGGRVQADIAVTPGDVLYIYVGGKGTDGRVGAGITAPGGYNGGGLGNNARDSYKGGGGGGATDIRLNGKALANRIVVAGGGGGSALDNGSGDDGGNGGDLIGAAGKYGGSSNPKAGVGGTQSSGGAAGVYPGYESGTAGTLAVGGSGGVGTSGGGGGGGYYGGGGGSWAGGGGGSSFTFAGSSDVLHTQGYQTGNGLVNISLPSNTVTLTQIAGLPSGASFPLGTTLNTYKATDTYGNSVTCSFKVIVNDKTNPTITAPAPVTISADPGKNTSRSYTWHSGNIG